MTKKTKKTTTGTDPFGIEVNDTPTPMPPADERHGIPPGLPRRPQDGMPVCEHPAIHKSSLKAATGNPLYVQCVKCRFRWSWTDPERPAT